MSLDLLQGYSSAEEEEDEAAQELQYDSDSDNIRNDGASVNRYKPLFDPNPSSSSSLPSALDAFSEISGPPQFLNNCVEEGTKDVGGQKAGRHGSRKNRKHKNDLPAGAVVEAKAQLVGIHERVRSDVEANFPQSSSGGTSQGVKRAAPNAEDGAELLRMCAKCGVPKTFSNNAKGIVCPICGDRPPTDNNRKKDSAVKEKEKLKRMKGQSSHATWKSETEMVLRQQFD